MRSFAVAIVALLAAFPAVAAEPPAEQRSELAPLQSREVIERLKTMRAQLLLEQEYNRLLEARLERQTLEAKLNGGTSAPKADKQDPAVATPRPPKLPALAPPPALEQSDEQLTVKAVTVSPFKEAIVTYKGRVYTVRPGDKLGAIQIRDVTESGVITAGAGSQKSAVMLGE